MSTAATSSRTWKKPPFIENPALRWGLIIGFSVYFILAFASMDVNWLRVYEGMARGLKFILAFMKPNFISRGGAIFEGIAESLVMTVAATVVGLLMSVPIGLGAARNIAPLPVYLFSRAIITLSRALNEIIVALFMVAIFGFGPFAGFIALAFASIGFLAKLLAEEIENTEKSQAEAVKATGASWPQWINYGIQPQFMPRLIGLSMYRMDANFRHSSVVGLVGAGGIGATLNTAFDRYEFDTAAAIILTIIAIVMALEYTSSLIRARLQ